MLLRNWRGGSGGICCEWKNLQPGTGHAGRTLSETRKGPIGNLIGNRPAGWQPALLENREAGFLAYLADLPQVAAIMRQDQGEALAQGELDPLADRRRHFHPEVEAV